MENNKLNSIEKQRAFIIRFAYGACIVLSIYIFMKWMLPTLMPFVLAAILGTVLSKLINSLSYRLHISRKILCIPVLLLFFALSGFALLIAVDGLISGVTTIVTLLSSFIETNILPVIDLLLTQLAEWLEYIAPDMEINFSDILPAIQKIVSSASSWLLSKTAGMVSGIPSMLIKTIVTVIATVFMLLDIDKIKEFLVRQIPDDKRIIMGELRSFLCGTLVRCLGSYVMIYGLTFAELLIGLLFLKVPNAPLIAMLIATIDIMPVLGTGCVLIPWGIGALIIGNYGLGAGFLLLYLAITVIRNTVEPKMVGRLMNLHPLITFASMLLGLRFMGLIGMLGFPLTLAFICSLNNKGIIHVFK